MIAARLLKRHNKKCEAIKQNPWCLLGDKFNGRGGDYWGTKSGNRGGSYRWIKALCLDCKCEAEIAIREDAILRFVSRTVKFK